MSQPIDTSHEAVWKRRYRAPSIRSAAIAPLAPERGLVWTNQSGQLQFHAWNVSTGNLTQLTHTPGGHNAFLHLSPDGHWAYFLQDTQGNEIGHYARIPYAGGAAEDITPDLPPYSSFFFSFSRMGNRLGFTTAAPDGFRVYLMEIGADGSLGSPRMVYQMQTIGFGPLLSADGRLAVMMTSEHSGKNAYSLKCLDAGTGDVLSELWDGEGTSIELNGFSPIPGDERLLATSNRSGIERLLLWNPRTGERRDLELDLPGAQTLSTWAADGDRMIVSAYHQAVQTLHLHRLSSGETRRLDTPGGELDPFYTPDGTRLFGLWNDAARNTRLVEVDEQSGAILRTLLSPGDAPDGRPMRSVSFRSSDGETIQGWLCLPEGDGPFPTILETHGGPTAVTLNRFNPGAQAWVDHGFAFLSINYRGSVTFGREFEQKIWNDLGHWEVEDMAAAHDFLVREGIARADAIFLTGWSYGGYLTLMGLGKRPELWAGGMAGIAIADWAVQWEDTADTLRAYQEALLGGTPAEVPERYRQSSPVTYAGAVRAPVLIIQGKNDTRTPARPVQMYEQKMKALGKDITVEWFETGHMGAFTDVELGIRHHERVMCFAADILQNQTSQTFTGGTLPMEQLPNMETGEDAPEITIDTEVSGDNIQFGPGFAVTVNANQDARVERAGAMLINAGHNVEVSYGGATAINAGGSAEVSFGGAMVMNVGGNVEISNGGAWALNAAKNADLSNSNALLLVTPAASAQHSTVGVLLSAKANLSDDTRVIFNTPQALALGAAAGAVFFLLKWLFRR